MSGLICVQAETLMVFLKKSWRKLIQKKYQQTTFKVNAKLPSMQKTKFSKLQPSICSATLNGFVLIFTVESIIAFSIFQV